MSLQAIVMCAQEHVMMIVFMFVMTLGMGLFINWNAYVSFPVFLVAVTLVRYGLPTIVPPLIMHILALDMPTVKRCC